MKPWLTSYFTTERWQCRYVCVMCVCSTEVSFLSSSKQAGISLVWIEQVPPTISKYCTCRWDSFTTISSVNQHDWPSPFCWAGFPHHSQLVTNLPFIFYCHMASPNKVVASLSISRKSYERKKGINIEHMLDTRWQMIKTRVEIYICTESKSYISHPSHHWKNIIPSFLHARHCTPPKKQHLGHCVQLFFKAQLQHLICLSQAKGKAGMLLVLSDSILFYLYMFRLILDDFSLLDLRNFPVWANGVW